MRIVTPLACFALLAALGCGGSPALRPDPVELKVRVQLAGGSPKDLTVSFQPLEDGQPIGGKVGGDGTVSVKTIPGKYTFYFPEEANAAVPAFKQVPAKYRSPNTQHVVTLSPDAPAVIEAK